MPTRRVAPLPTAPPASKLTSALSLRCSALGAETAAAYGAADIGRITTDDCEDYGREHGEIGVTCYEMARREATRYSGRMATGSERIAIDAMFAQANECVRRAEAAGR